MIIRARAERKYVAALFFRETFMSIYDSLNKEQYEAVKTTEGPLLILAGAGSGKTRVIVHRIAWILEQGLASPYEILAITFTNKAAEEMKHRVERIVPGTGEHIWVATFHATCARILRRFIDRIGYDNHFSIYDTDDQKTLLRHIIKRLNLDPKQFSERHAMEMISHCKEQLILPEEKLKQAVDYREQKLAMIYRAYEADLKKNNALDFDDLLVKTVELFELCPDVLEYYQNRFRYIHVDEYQDTNHVQFRLVAMLSKMHRNLCVVGDDDQSIYSFRGADITNILEFEQNFPGAKVIKLEQNYRSTTRILDVANSVIRNNRARKRKTMRTVNAEGEAVRFRVFEDARQEADRVISEVASRIDANTGYKDFAVLYRTNAQSRLFEESCIRQNVPYRIVGGINFYQRAEIKDVLAYLKTIDNGRDDLAVARIINVPKRGIGATTVAKCMDFASVNGLSLFDALTVARDVPGLSKATAEKIREFVNLILRYRSDAEGMTVDELIGALLDEIHYEDELDKLTVEEQEVKGENIDELISKAADFDRDSEDPTLSRFLEEVALVADIDSVSEGEDRMLLMTLHGAKGLEFDHVYLSGMEDGLFPSSMAINSGVPKDIEEERRLCYVGITRAKKTLTLTMAKVRMVRGETSFTIPSRFIREIEDGMLIVDGKVPARKTFDDDWGGSFQNRYRDTSDAVFTRASQNYTSDRSFSVKDTPKAYAKPKLGSLGYGSPKPTSFGKAVPTVKADHLDFSVGDRVRQSRFGVGTVLEITETPTDYKVRVQFDEEVSPKVMLAGFAQFEKIKE